MLLGYGAHHFIGRRIPKTYNCVRHSNARSRRHLLGFGNLVETNNALSNQELREIAHIFGHPPIIPQESEPVKETTLFIKTTLRSRTTGGSSARNGRMTMKAMRIE